MNTLVSGLAAIIPGGISAEDFAAVAKMDVIGAKTALLDLAANQIGSQNGESFEFDSGDRLRAAMLALQRGAGIDEVAENLDWRDFEGLAAQMLAEADFATIRNHILKNPRREIDVIGIKSGIAMLVDCKHWKRTSPSALAGAAAKQVERTRQYVEQTEGAIAVPVIVTLYEDSVTFSGRVPIVPVHRFASFIDEFYGNLEKMDAIGKS